MPLKSHAVLHPKGVLRMEAMCIHKTFNLCASVGNVVSEDFYARGLEVCLVLEYDTESR